jgi:hypothetical protein
VRFKFCFARASLLEQLADADKTDEMEDELVDLDRDARRGTRVGRSICAARSCITQVQHARLRRA